MGSDSVIYVPSFIKISSVVQKLIGGIHTETATGSHKPTLFFQNKESRLINITLLLLLAGLGEFERQILVPRRRVLIS
jgi:hypothetical protein